VKDTGEKTMEDNYYEIVEYDEEYWETVDAKKYREEEAAYFAKTNEEYALEELGILNYEDKKRQRYMAKKDAEESARWESGRAVREDEYAAYWEREKRLRGY
jgi:hypothetical protein